jgi:hypothetical protein
MKYVIIIAVVLAFSFIMGLVLGIVASDEDLREQEKEDRDQIEYLRRWGEKRRRS